MKKAKKKDKANEEDIQVYDILEQTEAFDWEGNPVTIQTVKRTITLEQLQSNKTHLEGKLAEVNEEIAECEKL